MCGIVGILANSPVAHDLVDALRRLEYRGYDSAGIATLEGAELKRVRAAGRLRNLERKLDDDKLLGHAGIGHTRWATHGAPTETNAHPHMTPSVSVVHNGIIENFRALRADLAKDGYEFVTDTDTETITLLLTRCLKAGASPVEAVKETLAQLEGAFALAILFAGEDDLLVAAREGSPLAIGHGDGEMYLGSDAIALAPFTNRITYLEDGDWALVRRGSVEIFDRTHQPVERAMEKSNTSALLVDKGTHRHFMLKEIHEQPEVIAHTLAHYVDLAENRIDFPDIDLPLADIKRITISACGTAYYAGLVGKYWIERWARVPVEIDLASELRYREAPLEPGGLSLFVSQSGETADTLATLRYCKKQGQHIAAVVNVPESTIARESHAVLPTLAGPEIGVASTKAFTCQLTVLACLAIAIGKAKGTVSDELERELIGALLEVPRHMSGMLQDETPYEALSHFLSKADDCLFLGRGISFPIAMEGALKLKEISYIHAEGYAAGELKHGPIALIDENMPVIVVAPEDDLFDKTVSNVQEVAARGGKIILISNAEDVDVGVPPVARFIPPKVHSFVTPFVYTLPVQLISYHTAVFMGTDVDQPRNLAKSVTVE